MMDGARSQRPLVVHTDTLQRLVQLSCLSWTTKCVHTTHLTGVAEPQLEILDLVVLDIATREEVVLDCVLDIPL